MKQYWLTIKLKPHATHPVSHGSAMWLKAYFDENPTERDQGEQYVGDGVRVPAEKTSVEQLLPQGQQVFHFSLTETEFNAATFHLYVWIEPYGAAALRLAGAMDDKAVGRLRLKSANVKKGGLPLPPPNSQSTDEQIVVETVELTNSVAQWVAEQMNANAASTKAATMKKLADQQREGQRRYEQAGQVAKSGSFFERLGAGLNMESAANRMSQNSLARNFIMGRAAHPDDEVDQYGGLGATILKRDNLLKWSIAKGLDGLLLGGGDWDLKPRISAVWGDKIRLGNREYYTYCDNFSNLHYGYVAGSSGFTATEANDLADIEEDDAPGDKKVTWKGIQLYERQRKVIWQDIVQFVDRMTEIQTYE